MLWFCSLRVIFDHVKTRRNNTKQTVSVKKKMLSHSDVDFLRTQDDL